MKSTKIASIILEKIQSPTATFKEIADLILMDKRLTAQILNLVNRSYCASPDRISDITSALQYIGMTTLVQVMLTSKVL
jgi:HD-like signal output (HDOD) protein